MTAIYIIILFVLYFLLALGIGYLESITIRKLFPSLNNNKNLINNGIAVMASLYLGFRLNDIIYYLNNY